MPNFVTFTQSTADLCVYSCHSTDRVALIELHAPDCPNSETKELTEFYNSMLKPGASDLTVEDVDQVSRSLSVVVKPTMCTASLRPPP